MAASAPTPSRAPAVSVVVPGVAWHVDRPGDAYCLPAETVVPLATVVGSALDGGRYACLRLPSGTLPINGRLLPLEPVPPGKVASPRAAALPWQPERPTHGAVDLSQDWRQLFHMPEVFTRWGQVDSAHLAAWEAYEKNHGPRATFRAGADRRSLRYIYPQLVPPVLCYRLGPRWSDLRDRARFATVAVEGELSLRGPDGWSALAGIDALGWRLTLRSAAGAGETVRRPGEAEALLASKAAFWTLVPVSGAAHLLLTTAYR